MPLARREESNDHLLLGRVFGVVSFETDRTTTSTPTRNSGALTPRGGSTCPGSTGIGTGVLYRVDLYPIPADAVEEMQTRCRDLMARRAAPASTNGYTPRPRPSR